MTKTKKVVFSAMFAALICVATMIIRIPTIGGYLNLGDCVVLLSGWVLGPAFGFCAAGIGSALADIFCGYTLYAPATFVIKGLMAVVAYALFNAIQKKTKVLPAKIISGAASELIMIAGYYIFESLVVYNNFITPAPNILTNAAQGAVCLVAAMLIMRYKLFEF